MTRYRDGVTPEDLDFTKSALVKSNALQFETLGALMGMLNTIAKYGLPDDYVKKEEEIATGMTLEQHRDLAQKYIQPDKMIYLVVGDAATQMKELKKLGLGDPILIDFK
jgi:zinc protease